MSTAEISGTEIRDAELAAAFDLLDVPEGYYDDPHVWFRRLRRHEPIHRNSDGTLLITRYRDVKAVWQDQGTSVDKKQFHAEKFGQGPLLEHHSNSMLFMDPPDHDRLRDILNPFFTPVSIDGLRPFVDALADEMLDEIADRREVDFVQDFSFKIPTAVICRILGVPRTDGVMLHNLGVQLVAPINPGVDAETIAAGHRAGAEIRAYFLDYLDVVRRRPEVDPRHDIMSALVSAQRRGVGVSDDEIVHSCILMFNGGHATTTALLSLTLHTLLDFPDQMAAWRADAGLTPTAVEECIRHVSPLQYSTRRVTRDITIPSGTIAAGTDVVVGQAAANRDETVFESPEELKLDRRPNAHVAFGTGIHFCIGRPLARMELEIIMPRVLRRFARIERTGPTSFHHLPRHRSLTALPVLVA